MNRIDTFMEEPNLDSIDLCKIDIEDNEIKSFLGIGEKITKIKISNLNLVQHQ